MGDQAGGAIHDSTTDCSPESSPSRTSCSTSMVVRETAVAEVMARSDAISLFEGDVVFIPVLGIRKVELCALLRSTIIKDLTVRITFKRRWFQMHGDSIVLPSDAQVLRKH